MGRKVSEDEVQEWAALYRKRYTYEVIGKQYGRNPKTVGKYVREYLRKHPKEEEGTPQDSELADLKKEKERYQVLAELDKLRLESQRIPERLEVFEGELSNLGITLKAFGEDLERLRLQLKSQPDFSKLKCPKCGDYMAVDVMCVSCNHKYCFGLWAEGE